MTVQQLDFKEFYHLIFSHVSIFYIYSIVCVYTGTHMYNYKLKHICFDSLNFLKALLNIAEPLVKCS